MCENNCINCNCENKESAIHIQQSYVHEAFMSGFESGLLFGRKQIQKVIRQKLNIHKKSDSNEESEHSCLEHVLGEYTSNHPAFKGK